MSALRRVSELNVRISLSSKIPHQFSTANLPAEVRLGYLLFRVRQFIPKPYGASSVIVSVM